MDNCFIFQSLSGFIIFTPNLNVELMQILMTNFRPFLGVLEVVFDKERCRVSHQ